MERWPEVRIGDLGEVFTGRTPSTERPGYFGKDFPFITPGDMHQGKYARETDRCLSQKGAELLKRIRLPAGSVCVSCIGWQMGEVIMTDRPSFTNQQINTIVPNGKVEPSFLFYSLRPRKQELLSLGAATGVRTPILNKSAFCDLKVKLPPLPVQRRIAGILSAYDDLIENSQRRIRILDAMARAFYREWFVHFRFPGHENHPHVASPVGDIPKGWEVRRIDEALGFESGRTIKKEDRENGDTPVYGANGIIGGTANPPMADQCIIMGKIGSCGALHRSHTPCWVTNNAFLVHPAAIHSHELAWQVLLDIDFRQYIGGRRTLTCQSIASGSTKCLSHQLHCKRSLKTKQGRFGASSGCLPT